MINYTPVIPKKAIIQPLIAFFSIFFFKKKYENIAVVIITPPLDICHTLLATIFKEIYDKRDAIRSITAGNNNNFNGAFGF